jgi:diguanylate cyclase (GGDEF)-like protein
MGRTWSSRSSKADTTDPGVPTAGCSEEAGLWVRVQVMAIQAVVSLTITMQLLAIQGDTPHVWPWLLAVLGPSALLLVLLRAQQVAIVWVTILDTVLLLVACSLHPTFGITAVVGVMLIVLLASYRTPLADRLALTLLVGLMIGLTVHHWGVITSEHGFLVALAAMIVMTVSSRDGSLVYLATLPLSDEPTSASGRDVLTGLANRQAFLQHVWRAIRWRHLNPAGQFAILFIDLDNFKPINDHLGHQAGDAVLQRIAKRLQARLKSVDVAARYGGDEFVLLLNQVQSRADVSRVADRLVTAIQEPVDVGQLVSVGASIGIALSTNVHAAPEDLIKDADAAMYRAKSGGKNQVVFSQQTQDASPVELKARLRRLVQAWTD